MQYVLAQLEGCLVSAPSEEITTLLLMDNYVSKSLYAMQQSILLK
jgi:hypothetical protein